MKWKEDVLGILKRIQDLVEGEDRAVEALEKRCDRLEEQNKELFNRLMSRNWESFATYSRRPGEDAPREEYAEITPEADEENAGTAMEMTNDASE